MRKEGREGKKANRSTSKEQRRVQSQTGRIQPSVNESMSRHRRLQLMGKRETDRVEENRAWLPQGARQRHHQCSGIDIHCQRTAASNLNKEIHKHITNQPLCQTLGTLQGTGKAQLSSFRNQVGRRDNQGFKNQYSDICYKKGNGADANSRSLRCRALHHTPQILQTVFPSVGHG